MVVQLTGCCSGLYPDRRHFANKLQDVLCLRGPYHCKWKKINLSVRFMGKLQEISVSYKKNIRKCKDYIKVTRGRIDS